MKRPFWIPWLLLSIALSGSAYSVSDPVSDEPQQSLPGESGKNDADDNRGEPGGRYLGACCLRTGNTERMARSIRSTSDSDLIVVEPKPLYEADYNAMPERAGQTGCHRTRRFSAYYHLSRGVGRLRHALRGLSDLVQAHGLADADLPARERRSAGHKRIALLAGSGSSGIGITERDAASLGARSRV